MNVEEIIQSMPSEALVSAPELPFKKIASGKVREIYDAGEHLLMLTTDRISAFDVVMDQGIPGKGIVLTQISRIWFDKSEKMIKNHLVPNHDEELAKILKGYEELIPRCMLVKKLKPLAIEAIVRGYITGSGWKDYKNTGKLFGQEAPADLVESKKLEPAYFTPTTKAEVGGHDEPISLEECAKIVGQETHDKVSAVSIELYEMGVQEAAKAGILLADTKFEFGHDDAGELYLIDEVLTPDSSRFWPAESYEEGKAPPSFDKQFLRDYLSGLDWNKQAPAPTLPKEITDGTADRYKKALEILASIA